MHLLRRCQNVIKMCQIVSKTPLAHNLVLLLSKADAKAEA